MMLKVLGVGSSAGQMQDVGSGHLPGTGSLTMVRFFSKCHVLLILIAASLRCSTTVTFSGLDAGKVTEEAAQSIYDVCFRCKLTRDDESGVMTASGEFILHSVKTSVWIKDRGDKVHVSVRDMLYHLAVFPSRQTDDERLFLQLMTIRLLRQGGRLVGV